MAPDVTPDALRQANFRSAFRGHDPAEVDALLHAVAEKLEQMDAERRKLEAKLDEEPGRNLESEFDEVGREVAAILQSAREAAEAMRDRASIDASRWRSEAMEEADTMRKEATADAEALRRDAWVTGTQLLEQTATKAESMRANAERDVLTIMGEAEREAHRLTSGARREAEDLVRNATMDSEKILADSTKRRDEIIGGANQQAAAAQERTRALEQRREELLEELENVRSTLTRLEGSLEERREALDLSGPSDTTSVRVVHPPADKQHWELGETVRVVPPDDEFPSLPAVESVTIVEPAPDPTPEPTEPEVSDEPEPEPEPASAPAPKPASASAPAPKRPPAEAPAADDADDDDLGALFASLRTSDDAAEPAAEASVETATEVEPDDEGSAVSEGTDWIAVREERLIPITNRALRGVKKSMTEVQNVALDSLRTEETWDPDEVAIAETLHAELVAVWSESFAAGHTVAEQMIGEKLKRPATPASDADRVFASDLTSAVSAGLEKAGDGARERQAAASRVFRVWRSDEAERRIRDIALRGYEAGLETSRAVVSER